MPGGDERRFQFRALHHMVADVCNWAKDLAAGSLAGVLTSSAHVGGRSRGGMPIEHALLLVAALAVQFCDGR